MKRLLTAISIFALATTVNAQDNTTTASTTSKTTMASKPMRFSIGVEGALPMGKFNDSGYKHGIGGSVQLEHMIASNVSVTLNGSYINYKRNNTTTKTHFSVIAPMAGLKFWFSPMFYAHGQLGVAFNNQKASNTTNQTSQMKSTAFAYSPGIGVMIGKNIDFSVKYFGNTFEYTNTNIKYTRNSIGGRLAFVL